MFKFFVVPIALFCSVQIQAQTYATPELQTKEEKHIAKKNARLGIITSSVPVSVPVSVERKSPFEISRLNGTYVFSSLEAVNGVNAQYSRNALQSFVDEATSKFESIIMAIQSDLSSLYFIDKKDLTTYNISTLVKNGDVLSIAGCKDCQDNTYRIKSCTKDTLVLELKPQDEGQDFIYLLTLKLKS